MLEDQDEEKLNNALGKITPDLTSPQRQVAPEQYDAKVERDYRSVAGDDKIESTDAAPFGREDMPSPASNISTAGSVQPFTIEGDASKRRIISQVLPQYPEGLQKEANVKIRFKVLPDGSIGQAIPVQKGDPTLDEISLRALRKWRFNPLPSSIGQVTVEGIITFHYRLR